MWKYKVVPLSWQVKKYLYVLTRYLGIPKKNKAKCNKAMHKNAYCSTTYKCGNQCPNRKKWKSSNIHMMIADKELGGGNKTFVFPTFPLS